MPTFYLDNIPDTHSNSTRGATISAINYMGHNNIGHSKTISATTENHIGHTKNPYQPQTISAQNIR